MRKYIQCIVIIGVHLGVTAQSVQLDKIGKDKWFKYRGNVRAMGLWYNGTAPRDTFGYMLQGGLNFTLGGIYHLPFSFTYSDQQFRFPSPVKLNRFSFHPSYKGIQLHLGDAAMIFMPYSLNGHQFTGIGLSIKTRRKWSFSTMYGRLLKQRGYLSEAPQLEPVLARRGYGLQVGYESEAWYLKASVFAANDRMPEVSSEEIIRYPFPERNLVTAIQTRFRVFAKGNILFDYANSNIGIKSDALGRFGIESSDSLGKPEKKDYKALKLQVLYPAFAGSLGVVFERIDPGYRTFGAYYFNSDLQNINVDVKQNVFKNKLNLHLRSGVQQDNLDNAKSSESKRYVNSVNVMWAPGETISLQGTYSNFQSFTNTRNQFDYYNRISEQELLDTLNYRQLLRQASLEVNYRPQVKREDTGTWSFLVSLQQNKSGQHKSDQPVNTGVNLYQGSLGYSRNISSLDLNTAISLNASYNSDSIDDLLIWGGQLNTSTSFYSKKLKPRLSVGYNLTSSQFKPGSEGSVFNTRLNTSYSFSLNHILSLSCLYQKRNFDNNGSTDLIIQLNYAYNFDNFRLLLQRGTGIANSNKESSVTVNFRFRDVVYSGTIPEVNRQLALVSRSPRFLIIPDQAKGELRELKSKYLIQDKRAAYKFNALQYLATLYHYGDLITEYYHNVDMVVRKIIHDMKKVDFELERRYVVSYNDLQNRNELQKVSENQEVDTLPAKVHKECKLKLKGHRWLEEQLSSYRGISFDESLSPSLKTYLDIHLHQNFMALENDIAVGKLQSQIEVSLIDHFFRWSLKHTGSDKVILRYHTIDK